MKLFKSEIVQAEIAQVWERLHWVHGTDRDNFTFTLQILIFINYNNRKKFNYQDASAETSNFY